MFNKYYKRYYFVNFSTENEAMFEELINNNFIYEIVFKNDSIFKILILARRFQFKKLDRIMRKYTII